MTERAPHSDPEIRIEPFDGSQELADTVATKHLEIRLRQRIDGENEFRSNIKDSQPDLREMQKYYVEPGGNFWIAKDASSQAIAGFVGLKREAERHGRLKRMSVMPEFRGRQLGLRLARTLVTWALEQDFVLIKLSTGKDELARSLVYEPLGFTLVGFDASHDDHLMELRLSS